MVRLWPAAFAVVAFAVAMAWRASREFADVQRTTEVQRSPGDPVYQPPIFGVDAHNPVPKSSIDSDLSAIKIGASILGTLVLVGVIIMAARAFGGTSTSVAVTPDTPSGLSETEAWLEAKLLEARAAEQRAAFGTDEMDSQSEDSPF
jgi:hypothetical protein